MADFTFQTESLDVGAVRVAGFAGHEAISQPFVFHIELVSDHSDLDIGAQIGSRAVLSLHGCLPSGERYTRFVHGVIDRFEHVGTGLRQSTYQATLVPALAPLQYTRNARIFQKLSTPDIVQKVLQQDGLPTDQVQFMLHGHRGARDYCVQYQESDLNFVHRLLEDEGIFYFFEHGQDKELLILGDGPHAEDTVPYAAVLRHFDKPNLYDEGVHDFRTQVVVLARFSTKHRWAFNYSNRS